MPHNILLLLCALAIAPAVAFQLNLDTPTLRRLQRTANNRRLCGRADINQDEAINVDDLLLVLSGYGQSCSSLDPCTGSCDAIQDSGVNCIDCLNGMDCPTNCLCDEECAPYEGGVCFDDTTCEAGTTCNLGTNQCVDRGVECGDMDLSGDKQIGVEDVLGVLSGFGITCFSLHGHGERPPPPPPNLIGTLGPQSSYAGKRVWGVPINGVATIANAEATCLSKNLLWVTFQPDTIPNRHTVALAWRNTEVIERCAPIRLGTDDQACIDAGQFIAEMGPVSAGSPISARQGVCEAAGRCLYTTPVEDCEYEDDSEDALTSVSAQFCGVCDFTGNGQSLCTDLVVYHDDIGLFGNPGARALMRLLHCLNLTQTARGLAGGVLNHDIRGLSGLKALCIDR